MKNHHKKKGPFWCNFYGRKAFTLVEILIVIGIIAVLAAIILVSLRSSRLKANGAAFKKTMSSMKAPIALCCADSTNHLATGAGGQALCLNATNNPVGSAMLPTPEELSLKTDGSSLNNLYSSVAPSCSNPSHLLRVNANAANGGTAINPSCTGAYRVYDDKVEYWNGTDWELGYPSGC